MDRFDIFVIMLVLYLGLSAWAYRDVGLKRPQHAEAEAAPAPARHRTHASYWQIALSTVAIFAGVVLIAGGLGLAIRGVFGSARWVVLTLGDSFPIHDAVTGLMLALLGALMVYETRYTIIRHPRPPRGIHHRLI